MASLSLVIPGENNIFTPGSTVSGKFIYDPQVRQLIEDVTLVFCGRVIVRSAGYSSGVLVHNLLRDTVVVLRGPVELAPQAHEWPFAFRFPNTALAPSYYVTVIYGESLCVEYTVEAVVNKSRTMARRAERKSIQYCPTIPLAIPSPPSFRMEFPSSLWGCKALRDKYGPHHSFGQRIKHVLTKSGDPGLPATVNFDACLLMPRLLGPEHHCSIFFSVSHGPTSVLDIDLALMYVKLELRRYTRYSRHNIHNITGETSQIVGIKTIDCDATHLDPNGEQLCIAHDFRLADLAAPAKQHLVVPEVPDHTSPAISIWHSIRASATVQHVTTRKSFYLVRQQPLEVLAPTMPLRGGPVETEAREHPAELEGPARPELEAPSRAELGGAARLELEARSRAELEAFGGAESGVVRFELGDTGREDSVQLDGKAEGSSALSSRHSGLPA